MNKHAAKITVLPDGLRRSLTGPRRTLGGATPAEALNDLLAATTT